MNVSISRTLMSFSVAILACLAGHDAFCSRGSGKDPEWMVQITKNTEANALIRGTGYIVQIGSEYFVRTSSHVTLGGLPESMVTGSGEQLVVRPDQGISDNDHDDQLIAIEPPQRSAAIAFYSQQANNFVVFPDQFEKTSELERRTALQSGLEPAFYIVPSWSTGDPRPRRHYEIDFSAKDAQTIRYSEVRLARNERTFFSTINIYPGESGAPVFQVVRVGYEIRDLLGQTFTFNLKNKSGWAPVILGHGQEFHCHFNMSNFSAPLQAKSLVEEYMKGRRGHLSDSSWGLQDDMFFRFKNTTRGRIQEVNFADGKAGNGIKGNGGNTVGSKNTDGAIVGDLRQFPSGMIYQGLPIIAFRATIPGRVTREELIYASWDNYLYTEDIRREQPSGVVIEPLLITQMETLIREKFKTSGNNDDGRGLCLIDRKKLDNQILSMRLLADPVEVVEVPLTESTPPVLEVQLRNSVAFVDIRGLYSSDASEFSHDPESGFSEYAYYQKRPYVAVKIATSQDLRLVCRLTAPH